MPSPASRPRRTCMASCLALALAVPFTMSGATSARAESVGFSKHPAVFAAGLLYARFAVPRIYGGTYWNGVAEVGLGRSAKWLDGGGLYLDASWWSDEKLWDAIDSLEYVAGGSYTSVGSVAPSIEGSLDDLYDEDDLRDDESFGPPNGRGLVFNMAYRSLDGSTYNSMPVGATNVANTYLRVNPLSGWNNVWLGATGQDVRIRSEFDETRLRLSYLERRGLFSGGHVLSGPRISFNYGNQVHNVDVTSPTWPVRTDFSSNLNYDLDEYRFGVGYSIFRDYKVNQKFSIGLGLGADLTARTADLKATQVNQCSAIAGCPATEANVVFREERDDSGLTLDVDAQLAAAYRLSPKTTLNFGISGQYTPHYGRIVTKDNPALPLLLNTDSMGGWNAFVGFRHDFYASSK